MSEADFLNEFNGRVAQLAKLMKSWDLLKGNSIGGVDKLAEKVLSKLYEGQTAIEIKRIIESELCGTYGLYNTEFDSGKLTREVMNWWNE